MNGCPRGLRDGLSFTVTCHGCLSRPSPTGAMANREGIQRDQRVTGADVRAATRSIRETMSDDPQLAGFLEMFRKSGIDSLLDAPGLVTLFAPQGLSSGALAGKAGQDLESTLRGHILGRAVTLDELRTTTGIATIAHTLLSIDRDGVETNVNGIRIVRPDVPCTNGVIHVIERPIEMPQPGE